MGSAFLRALAGTCAVGIFSHILLDLVNLFGTMIWSPLQWSRPAWTSSSSWISRLTAILLVPQLLAWSMHVPTSTAPRRSDVVGVPPGAVSHREIGERAGAPISGQVVLSAMLASLRLFLLPAVADGA